MEKRGFTLIELLIVIAIAVIISGALVPLFSVTKQDAKRAKASSELDSIRTAAIMLNHDTGTWPTTGSAGAGLVTNSPVVTDWAGPYLDAWKAIRGDQRILSTQWEVLLCILEPEDGMARTEHLMTREY